MTSQSAFNINIISVDRYDYQRLEDYDKLVTIINSSPCQVNILSSNPITGQVEKDILNKNALKSYRRAVISKLDKSINKNKLLFFADAKDSYVIGKCLSHNMFCEYSLGDNIFIPSDIIYTCDSKREFKITLSNISEEHHQCPEIDEMDSEDIAAVNIMYIPQGITTIREFDNIKKKLYLDSIKYEAMFILIPSSPSQAASDAIYKECIFAVNNGIIVFEKEGFNFDQNIVTVDLSVNKHLYDFEFDCDRTKIYGLKTNELAKSSLIVRNPYIERYTNKDIEDMLDAQSYLIYSKMKYTKSKAVILGLSGGLDSTMALLALDRFAKQYNFDRKNIFVYSMPCFGTSNRTKNNAQRLALSFGVTFEEIDISHFVENQLEILKHDKTILDHAYENAQARARTMFLLNKANMLSGLVIGTGDLSESILGWATFAGDHIANFNINTHFTKTMIIRIIKESIDNIDNDILKDVLNDILNTPISPELLPSTNGEISQKTEDILGPYELYDFLIYYYLNKKLALSDIYERMLILFNDFEKSLLDKYLLEFVRRYKFSQFKRTCSPEGAGFSDFTVSSRVNYFPSDETMPEIFNEIDEILRKN